MGKIGITCRQPFLGADEWIAEEIKKAEDNKSDKPAAKKEADKPAAKKEADKPKKIVEVKEK